MSTKKARRIAVLAGALVLLAALWALAGRASAVAGEEWAEVRREDLVLGVEVAGTLSAVESANIGPPQVPDVWSYKIAFMAPEGSEVREGQPVLGFDSSELQRLLQDKMAERDSAQKELEKRQTNLEMSRGQTELRLAEAEARLRKATLKVDVPDDLVARNELAEARADLELAKREVAYYKGRLRSESEQAAAEVETLRAKRDNAASRVAAVQLAIARMTVTAPRDGTVVYVNDHRGDKKKVGDSTWRGEGVLEIPDLKKMKALGQVDEADAGRLAVGQPVSLRLDAHPDVAFTGRVRTIHGSVQRKSSVSPQKVVNVEILLDRTDPQRMRPGMRFLGTVELERIPGALVVPAEAVVSQPGGPVVYRRAGWRLDEVRPTLGQRNGRLVEVKEGLALGEQVALRGGGAGGDAEGEGGEAPQALTPAQAGRLESGG